MSNNEVRCDSLWFSPYPSNGAESTRDSHVAYNSYPSPSKVKVKVKFTLYHATKAQRWSRGITLLFLTSTVYGVVGQRHAPGTLPPGKTRYPLYRRLGGPQGRSGRVREKLAHNGDPRTVEPAVSRYTDCAIAANPVS